MKVKTYYKLFRQRKDGTIGPLFINRKQRVTVGEWLEHGDYPTKGFAHRPGWHLMGKPEAPHLNEKGRVWYTVEADGVVEYERPRSQGGSWYLAKRIKVIGPVA